MIWVGSLHLPFEPRSFSLHYNSNSWTLVALVQNFVCNRWCCHIWTIAWTFISPRIQLRYIKNSRLPWYMGSLHLFWLFKYFYCPYHFRWGLEVCCSSLLVCFGLRLPTENPTLLSGTLFCLCRFCFASSSCCTSFLIVVQSACHLWKLNILRIQWLVLYGVIKHVLLLLLLYCLVCCSLLRLLMCCWLVLLICLLLLLLRWSSLYTLQYTCHLVIGRSRWWP